MDLLRSFALIECILYYFQVRFHPLHLRLTYPLLNIMSFARGQGMGNMQATGRHVKETKSFSQVIQNLSERLKVNLKPHSTTIT